MKLFFHKNSQTIALILKSTDFLWPKILRFYYITVCTKLVKNILKCYMGQCRLVRSGLYNVHLSFYFMGMTSFGAVK